MRATRYPWTLGCIVYGAAFVLATIYTPLAAAPTGVVGHVVMLPLDVAMLVIYELAAYHYRLDRHHRRAFHFIALASLVSAAGRVLTLSGIDPNGTWDLVLSMAYYPLILGALLSFPHAKRARIEWWKFALDAATVVIGGVVAVWFFILSPAAHRQIATLPALEALAYPISDLVLLVPITSLLLRPGAEQRSLGFVLFLTGMLFGIATDLVATVFLPVTGTFVSQWPQVLYMLYGGFTVAGGEQYLRAPRAVLPPRRADPLTGSAALSRYQLASPMPYAAAATVYLLALVVAIHRWPSPLSGLVIAAGPVTLLLMARGVVANRQNARLLVERAERAGQARLVALLDATTDLVVVTDANGGTTYINRAGRRMIGLSDDADVASIDLGTLYEPTALAAANRDGVWQGESAVVALDGREIPVSQVIVAHPPLLSTIMRDISGWKRLDRMKSEFVSTVSHELRTPLTAIRGSLGLLEGGKTGAIPQRATELIHVARRNCDRLVRLLNDMLDLDKIEAGKLELRPTTLSPSDVVRATVDELNAIAQQRGVLLVEQVAATEAVHADRDRVIQVLTNLVGNAIKFSPASSTATIAVRPGVNGTVRFAVENPGPGIAPHDIPRLFGRFQQLDSSDKRQYGGSGLGLAIAKGIVEQHGGRIGVMSEPNVLTTFWFELPAAERPAA